MGLISVIEAGLSRMGERGPKGLPGEVMLALKGAMLGISLGVLLRGLDFMLGLMLILAIDFLDTVMIGYRPGDPLVVEKISDWISEFPAYAVIFHAATRMFPSLSPLFLAWVISYLPGALVFGRRRSLVYFKFPHTPLMVGAGLASRGLIPLHLGVIAGMGLNPSLEALIHVRKPYSFDMLSWITATQLYLILGLAWMLYFL